MAETEFFPQRPSITPTIYAYKLDGVDSHKGYIKVGYTERDAATRIKEQLHLSNPPCARTAHALPTTKSTQFCAGTASVSLTQAATATSGSTVL